jgi:hypothetical protein
MEKRSIEAGITLIRTSKETGYLSCSRIGKIDYGLKG